MRYAFIAAMLVACGDKEDDTGLEEAVEESDAEEAEETGESE